MQDQKPYQSIEKTADLLGLSPYFLRQGIRAGWIPHIRCGVKAMINLPKLIEILNSKSVNG